MISNDPGTRWFDEAGPWADEPIGRFSFGEIAPFVTVQDRREDVAIDARRIMASDHARYNQGMTWREFLRDGQRVESILKTVREYPEYFSDPVARDGDPGGPHWTLYEIEGDYYLGEGNHRSVVAKFRALADGIVDQRIPVVLSLTVSKRARTVAAQLDGLMRGRQGFLPDRVEISEPGENPIRYFCGFRLFGFGVRVDMIYAPDDALEIVLQRNRWRYRIEGMAARLPWWRASEEGG